MQQHWTIYVCDACGKQDRDECGCFARLRAVSVVPEVPRDDAAIERGVEAARRRHQEWFNRRLRGDVGGEWLDSEDFAGLVEDILRAAGETP